MNSIKGSDQHSITPHLTQLTIPYALSAQYTLTFKHDANNEDVKLSFTPLLHIQSWSMFQLEFNDTHNHSCKSNKLART